MSMPSAPARGAAPVISFYNAATDSAEVTIAASSEAETMPVSNLRTPSLDRPWQSADGKSPASISWHYNGGQRLYPLVSLERFVWPWEATVSLEYWSGYPAGSGDRVYDSGPLFSWSPYLPPREIPVWGSPGAWPRRSDHQLAALRTRFIHCPWDDVGERVRPIPHRSGRIVLAYPPGVPTYWQAANLWIGDAWQPGAGLRKITRAQSPVGGSAEEGPAGQYYAANRVFVSEQQLTFQGPEWEMDEIEIGARIAGDAAPFLIWPRPWDATRAFLEAGLYRPVGAVAKTDLEAWDNTGQRIWNLQMTAKEWL